MRSTTQAEKDNSEKNSDPDKYMHEINTQRFE